MATGEQLKQELFSSVQRITVKDHETEQVVKVAENATVRSCLHEFPQPVSSLKFLTDATLNMTLKFR